MWALLDDEGRPVGFYREEIHGENIPGEAVEIDETLWRECLENPGRRRIDEDYDLVTCDPPKKVETEKNPRKGVLDRWR